MFKKYIYTIVIIAAAVIFAISIYFFYDHRIKSIEQKIQQPP